MKAQMLKLAGVKTEAAFYKKYPTQEAFMKVHGEELKKAQNGFNPGNTSVASSIGYKPMSTSLTSGASSIGGATSKMPGVGQMVGAATGIIDAFGAFKKQKNELQGLIQQNQVVGKKREAQNSVDVDLNNMNKQLMWRPEDDIVAGGQLNAAQGTGTNILNAKYGRILQNGGGLQDDSMALKEMDELDQITEYEPDDNDMTDEEAKAFMYMYNKDMIERGEADSDEWERIEGDKAPSYDKNSARDTWVTKTGLPWSAAKKLGYTTGSAKDNTKLLAELNDPRFKKENLRSTNPKSNSTSRTPIAHRETPTGRLTSIKKPIQSFSEATKGKLKGRASSSDIHTPDEGNLLTRLGEYAANPFQTIGEYSKYGEAPAEGFSKNNKNAYDQSLGLINPAYWANAAANAVDYASEKQYKKAALEALDALPAASKLKYTKYLPYLEGLPAGRAYGKAAKQLGEGAKRLSGPASKQLGRGTAKQLKQPFTPNFVMYENGGEIQNTYAPNDLYDDLEEYKSGGVVKAAGGFSSFMGAGGTDFANKMVGNAFGNNAGSQMGQAVGGALKMIPGVGPVAGAIAAPILGALGGLADNAFGSAGKIKDEKKELTAQTDAMTSEAGVKSFQGQNTSVMEDGGYVSNDWTPQVITKFGDHSAKDFYDFSHEGMDTLRAGGQLRGEYTPVSERGLQTYALGGEVETTWGGGVEPIAYNPYLPKSGQIVEFKGNSHTERDGNGHTGIGVKYGNKENDSYTDYAEFGSKTAEAQVEVQDGEPGHIDDQGNFNVGGALPLSLKMAKQIGTPELVKLAEKYDGMKVQNIIKDNAAKTRKVNDGLNKTMTAIDSFTARDSVDAIKENSLAKMAEGFKGQLKNLAGDINTITNFQTSVNDTARDISDRLGYNISADHLAKYGTVKRDTDPVTKDSVAEKGKKVKKGTKPTRFAKPALENLDIETPAHLVNKSYNKTGRDAYTEQLPFDIVGDAGDDKIQPIAKNILAQDAESNNDGGRASWMDILNSVLPQMRPSNAEGLDQRQILGELNALSQNQLEPVQAQRFSPQLLSPSQISLQDQMNEITAQTRALQKMSQGNPAAQFAIAAQAYDAINKIKGEEFRINQDRADKVYTGNIGTLNDAQLKNLAIFDNQYSRQASALSNTKAINQAALQGISDKYLQNDAANRKLQVAENTYNYRYDSNGRLINMNPLQQFSPSGAQSKTGGKGLAPGYEFTYDADQNIIGTRKAGKDDVAKNGAKVKGKNSSIVKAMKNL